MAVDGAWLLGGLLGDVATVRTRGAGGAFSVVDTAGLSCRLLHVNPDGAASSRDRVEIAATRRLLFDPGYTLPLPCVIEVRGQRWRPIDNRTVATYRDIDDHPIYAAVDVVRTE